MQRFVENLIFRIIDKMQTDQFLTQLKQICMENSDKGSQAMNGKEEEKKSLPAKTIRASLDEHFNYKKKERKVLLKINSSSFIASINKTSIFTRSSEKKKGNCEIDLIKKKSQILVSPISTVENVQVKEVKKTAKFQLKRHIFLENYSEKVKVIRMLR